MNISRFASSFIVLLLMISCTQKEHQESMFSSDHFPGLDVIVNQGVIAVSNPEIVVRHNSDRADIENVYFSLDSKCENIEWLPSEDEHRLTLSGGDGPKSIFMKIKTKDNLESKCIEKVVFLDRIGPFFLNGKISFSPPNFNSLSQSPLIQWTLASDAVSGVDYYEYSIGSTPNGEDVLPWTLVGNVASVTAVDLNLAPGREYFPSIRAIDRAGNTGLVLAGSSWIVEQDSPQILSFELPARGTYRSPQPLDFKILFTEKVLVQGNPRIAILIGDTFRYATYFNGSGSSTLTFRYVIQSGDNDSDGIVAKSLDLNSGRIEDEATNLANLNVGFPENSEIIVDTLSPVVSALTTPSEGRYRGGQLLNFSLIYSEPVKVFGLPRIPFVVGTQTRYAYYSSGTGSNTLNFQYAVQSGDNDLDGIVMSPLDLNWGSITDLIGNPARNIFASPDTSKVLVDTLAPSVLSIQVPANGFYKAGKVLEFKVSFSENVIVSGVPQLGLIIGETSQYASYVSGSGTRDLIFRYTLLSSDSDGNGISGGLFALGDSKIEDEGGNGANLSLTFPSMSQVIVDNVPPVVAGVSVPAFGQYRAEGILTFELSFSEKVVVSGTPRIPVQVGSVTRYASYSSGNGTAKLTFQYSILAGDNDDDGVALGALDLNGGSLIDLAGLEADNFFLSPDTSGVLVDTESPQFLTVFGPPIGIYNSGSVLEFSMSVSEPVFVTGTPRLALNIGDVLRYAIYASGSGSQTLNFRYTVVSEDLDENGIIVSSHLDFNGSKIIDRAGNSLSSALSPPETDLVNINSSAFNPMRIAAGTNHSCGINTSGVLKCWGGNSYGQLGDGTNIDRTFPVTVDPGTSYVEVSAGGNHTCAISSEGVLKCWGINSGEIGDGSLMSRNAPVVIDSGVSYSKVSAGDRHTCAVTSTGVLKCWGVNANGRLGDGTTGDKTLPTEIDPGVSYRQVVAGGLHTCALTKSGILKCWGDNLFGQLGDGTNTNKLVPTIIDSGSNYFFISVGANNSCAITVSGVLKCWGSNIYGRIGDGTTVGRNVPVPIDSSETYKYVSTNDGSCGITSKRILKCWGFNNYGRVGDGTITDKLLPVIVDSSSSYAQVKTDNNHTCAITTLGVPKCWGTNSQGQLGDGSKVDRYFPVLTNGGNL